MRCAARALLSCECGAPPALVSASAPAQREKSRRTRSTLLLRPERLLEFGKHSTRPTAGFLGTGSSRESAPSRCPRCSKAVICPGAAGFSGRSGSRSATLFDASVSSEARAAGPRVAAAVRVAESAQHEGCCRCSGAGPRFRELDPPRWRLLPVRADASPVLRALSAVCPEGSRMVVSLRLRR